MNIVFVVADVSAAGGSERVLSIIANYWVAKDGAVEIKWDRLVASVTYGKQSTKI